MYLTILFLFVSSILLSLMFLLRKHLSHFSYQNLPPGKTGFPLIGESLSFLSEGSQGHPEKFITDRVRRFISSSSGVFKTHLFGSPTAVMTGASGNKFLFTNENKLVVSWWPDSVKKIFPYTQSTYTEESKKLRILLLQFMKPEALRKYIGVMDEVTQRHFETEWTNKKQLIVYPLSKKLTFSIACRLFLSMDDPERVSKLEERFNSVVMGIYSIPIDLPGTRFNRSIKASRLIRKEVCAIIGQRREELKAGRASAEQDVLSHMLTSVGETKDEDLANYLIGILIGGHDTAAIATTFIISYLAEYPHVYQRVLQEQKEILNEKKEKERLKWEDIEKMKYSWNVACEVMRLVPPLTGTFREAIDHFTFKGFYIPKGWKLYWSATATHMNPDYFPEPERFEPNRFEGSGPKPYTYIPFGGGPRMCPGREFARLEILVIIHNLVNRFKWEKVSPNENKIVVDPLPKPGNGLPIRIFPHF
uniref:CYP716A80 n=1 Tax=Barbarea vulgaris subsp. arcuata TaxID=767412 RepID=A0A0U2TQ31_BARVU|nr:CYP716A80 [Barbarea vulgaris subsp. arcuata]